MVREYIEWSTRSWNRCSAVFATNGYYDEVKAQCDRKRNHLGDHCSRADGLVSRWSNTMTSR